MATDHATMTDPCGAAPGHPVVDADSEAVQEGAIWALTMLRATLVPRPRSPASVHSAACRPGTLLAGTIIDASDQECSWSDIASQPGTSPDNAHRRFRNAEARRPPIELD